MRGARRVPPLQLAVLQDDDGPQARQRVRQPIGAATRAVAGAHGCSSLNGAEPRGRGSCELRVDRTPGAVHPVVPVALRIEHEGEAAGCGQLSRPPVRKVAARLSRLHARRHAPLGALVRGARRATRIRRWNAVRCPHRQFLTDKLKFPGVTRTRRAGRRRGRLHPRRRQRAAPHEPGCGEAAGTQAEPTSARPARAPVRWRVASCCAATFAACRSWRCRERTAPRCTEARIEQRLAPPPPRRRSCSARRRPARARSCARAWAASSTAACTTPRSASPSSRAC